MNTITIQPGSVGADYVKLTNGICEWLLDNNARFVVRYVAQTTKIGKIITPEEIKWLHNHDIAVVLIYEGQADDTLKGGPGGVTNGIFAAATAKELGYPKGLPIQAAADIDLGGSNLKASRLYMEAFKTAVTSEGYTFGMYADEDLAEVMECDMLTVPNAKGWSRRLYAKIRASLPWGLTVHVLQSLPNASRVDPLKCYTPFQAWLPPLGQDMPAVSRGSRGEAVREAQRLLKVRVDGMFGPVTEKAVKKFQKDAKLRVDGIVGPKTWNALLKRNLPI